MSRKNSHVNKVISEFKTAQMQETVIKSLSNIESLMINKLTNTSQKLQVLKNSDKQIPFAQIELEAESYMDTVSLIRGNLGRPALPKDRRIYFMQKKHVV